MSDNLKAPLGATWRRFRALLQRRVAKQEIDEELRFHIEQRVAENIAAGMTPDEAAREARKRFGNMQSLREECREVRGADFGESALRGIRLALRQLRRSPGFTSVAVLTLALCIGANISIFAVVDAILLRSLPFRDSERLVTLYNSYPKANIPRIGSSLTSYYERRGHIRAIESLAEISEATSIIGEAGSTSREKVGRVSTEFFSTLGVNPFLGRAFSEEEMTYKTDLVAMISYEYWRARYNGDPGALGRSVRTDGISRVIVGVLPPGFHFLTFGAPVYMPLSSEPRQRDVNSRHSNLDKIQIARLAPGVNLEEAQAQVDGHNNAIAGESPEAQLIRDSGFRTVVAPLHADYVAAVRPILILLQAAVLLLLAIGAVNLVNLLLIRASARARELGIRQSLGATWRHVVGLVMTETVLLALVGGVLGLMIGAGGIRLLDVLGVNQLPLGAGISFNARLAAIALIAAIGIGVLIAVPVAWFNLRGHVASALQSAPRGDTGNLGAQRLRHGFIVAQIALAFVLLAGTSLLAVSLKRVMAVQPGFRPDHVITGQFSLPGTSYADSSALVVFFDRLYQEIGAQPGVSAVGAISTIPLNGERSENAVFVPGYVVAPGSSLVAHGVFAVAGDYFAAMGIPLRAGRYLSQDDAHNEQRLCVVDEDFAQRYWPGDGAVGKQVYIGTKINPGERPLVVVGVVGAVKQSSLTDSLRQGALYIPYTSYSSRDFYIVARTSTPPESLADTLSSIVRKIDPNLPLTDVRTLEVRISDSLITRRSPALLAGVFALVALLLAAVGTYGVLGYAVAQRRREIGVRMALGALPGQVCRYFLGIGLRLIAFGGALGVLGAWMAGRAMQSVLFDVPALHIATLAATAATLTIVSLCACWLPARRAARVDPMEALRHE